MTTTLNSVLVAVTLAPWQAACIALENTPLPLMPAFDLVGYASYSIAFGTLEDARSELALDGDNFGKPRYRFRTIDEFTLKVIEHPDLESIRSEYRKAVSEITFGAGAKSHFDASANDYIFAWSDRGFIGKRLISINLLDKLVSVLELPAGSPTIPFGTLQLLKCKNTGNDVPSTRNETITRHKVNTGITLSNQAVPQGSTARPQNRSPSRRRNVTPSASSSPRLIFER